MPRHDALWASALSWKPDRSGLKRPIYASLAEQLERDIADGSLAPGVRLPSQRDLADYLGINFTTVTRAYRLCELKGLLYATTGSGTFVAPNAARSATISTANLARESIDLGFVGSFESCNAMVADAIASVARNRHVPQLLDYDHPTGMPHHKAAGVDWLRGIGLRTDTDHLAIVSGTQNGLALALIALFEPGDRIAVDTYTYANFIELAKTLHIQLAPIAADDEGMRADELEAQHGLNPVQGVFLMPSCCNPTTAMISERRKRELADVIARHRLILIEDDIHALFTAGVVADYQGPMARLVPERTIYLCGTSKPICSGLRVAYLVYPDEFRERILQALFNVNVKTSSLDAEIISELIASGTANEIIHRKRDLLAETNALFRGFFPDAPDFGHPLSFYRWLPIDDQRDGARIEKELQKAGVRVYHSDRFLSGPRQERRYLRIALSTAGTPERLAKGLSILSDYLSDNRPLV
ncbi:transcriptional regulator GntR family with aminotransferase domain [Bifidobacterium lemurum]|uniref:Transcriptional regulator GntR family with aminotransferase domain n=1 Tax=Bifidobacterium lemurum TaxID=1603886 RepID=A0A261FM86_9BIFI|nr:PLP-dependent aminotransferase family protein [Bifidobacterium lemurum]OZG59926.1 transcriptional regulator GntR family with aminotransferase domain [Bifidobacterium lemurum]QOL33948.1 PLP-dependent aminotransferase family protein [Bifidobacterium lemurum]